MDLTKREDGHLHFSLGPVERWVLGAGVTLLFVAAGFIFTSITGQMQDQGSAIKALSGQLGDVKTQQAVTNAQLAALNQQLANVAGLTNKVAEMKVQLDRNSSDIHELQQVKGLH